MNLNKDPSSWAQVSAKAVITMSSAQAAENVLGMALEDIQCQNREIERLRTHVRALLGQLEGRPIKHPQQTAEREAARAALT